MSECHEDIKTYTSNGHKWSIFLSSKAWSFGAKWRTVIKSEFWCLLKFGASESNRNEVAVELWYLINSSIPMVWANDNLDLNPTDWPMVSRYESLIWVPNGFFTSPFSPQASLGGLGGTKQLTGKTSKRFFEGWASGWVTTLQCPVLEFVFQTANGCRSVGYTVTNSALIPFSFQPDTLRHHLILSTFPVCLPLVRHSTSMSNPVCYPRPPWASSDQLWKFTFFISYCKILRKNSHIYQSLRAKLQIV